MPHRARAGLWAAAAVLLVAGCQWATVAANYHGDWTALFCAGASRPQPPAGLAGHVYLFPGSGGYDGQFYREVAHDPFLRRGLQKYADDPRLRYRRILVPLAAYGLGLGQARWIDPAYIVVCLLVLGMGVYWSCRLAEEAQLDAAWGLLFLLAPAIPITADRMVIDGALAALTAGALYYGRGKPWKLLAVLAAAALVRETGLLLILASFLYRAGRREFRAAFLLPAAAVPAAAWYAWVQARTGGLPYQLSPAPLSAIARVLLHPWHYPAEVPLAGAVVAGDYLALAGVLLAFLLAIRAAVRGPRDPAHWAAVLFTAMGVVVQRTDHWQHVYDFGRVYTPLLLGLAAVAAREKKAWLLAPGALMLPRIAMQLTPQLLGVLHRLA